MYVEVSDNHVSFLFQSGLKITTNDNFFVNQSSGGESPPEIPAEIPFNSNCGPQSMGGVCFKR